MITRFLSVSVLALAALTAADPAIGSGPPAALPPGSNGALGGQCSTFIEFTASDGCSICSCSVDARMTDCTRDACPEPRGNYTINECVENLLYLGSDGCNRCQCSAWRTFTFCTRNICRESDLSPVAATSSTARPANRPTRPPRRPTRRPYGTGVPTQRPPLSLPPSPSSPEGFSTSTE